MSEDRNIWQHAQEAVERSDLEQAHALGFDTCHRCGEWFHLIDGDWIDCVRCGRHCPACAEGVGWEWCANCGLYYCHDCIGHDYEFECEVCLIED